MSSSCREWTVHVPAPRFTDTSLTTRRRGGPSTPCRLTALQPSPGCRPSSLELLRGCTSIHGLMWHAIVKSRRIEAIGHDMHTVNSPMNVSVSSYWTVAGDWKKPESASLLLHEIQNRLKREVRRGTEIFSVSIEVNSTRRTF